MKHFTRVVIIGTAALLLAPAVSFGQAATPEAYVVDRNGNPVTAARTGECVRTRNWTPASSHPRCKPEVTPASTRAQPSRK
jgi:hypothetical protein